MGNNELVSVRERLENLRKNPKHVPRPLDLLPEREKKPLGEGMFTLDRVYQQKIEKAISKLEVLKNKMKSSEMFSSYYYDLKKAEKEFIDVIAEAESKKLDFPENFLKRVADIKRTLRR